MSFKYHIEYVRAKLGKQCRIISKLRHFAPRKQLFLYYKSNFEPIIQYNILVYGCCKYTSSLPILMMQKKILKFIYFRERHDSSDDLFIQNGILTVFELHLYELLKFSLKSVNNVNSEKYCNDMLKYEESKAATRRQRKGFLSLSLAKRKYKDSL